MRVEHYNMNKSPSSASMCAPPAPATDPVRCRPTLGRCRAEAARTEEHIYGSSIREAIQMRSLNISATRSCALRWGGGLGCRGRSNAWLSPRTDWNNLCMFSSLIPIPVSRTDACTSCHSRGSAWPSGDASSPSGVGESSFPARRASATSSLDRCRPVTDSLMEPRLQTDHGTAHTGSE